jgi:hypothetical protein
MKSEKRAIEEILEKSEAQTLAYFPYATAVGCSFAPVAVRIDAEQEE